jgi:hypothetical protein
MHTLDAVAPVYSGRALGVTSAPYLRLDRNNLRANAVPQPVAVFNDFVWVFGQHYSTEIDIPTPCIVRFEGSENTSQRYGPFSALHIDGPSIFVGPRFDLVRFAYDLQRHQWRDCLKGGYHDVVVIEPV